MLVFLPFKILWEGPVFPSLASCFGEAKAGHFGHQPKISKPLCFYFSSMLGTGEILWEGPVFLPWQAVLAQRRRAIPGFFLESCFGAAKAGHFGRVPRIPNPLYMLLCFFRSESNFRHGRDPVGGRCFGTAKAGHFVHQPKISKHVCLYFFFRSEVRHGRDPVGRPRFSFPGKLFRRSEGGPFWPPAQDS